MVSGQHGHVVVYTTANTARKMNQTIFESLGLSPNEAKIYQTLVERGESSISEIATSAQIHRRNAYDAMQRLIDKGLCFQIFSSKENKYNAADPGKLTELLKEKENELGKLLPDLQAKFGKRLAPEEAYIYRGYEGQKNIWRDILRVGKDIKIIGAKAQWFDEKLNASRDAFYREVRRKKMKFHIIFDKEIREKLPDFTKNYPASMEFRYLPKKYSTTSIIVLFGDYVVMYAGVGIMKMSEQTVFFVIHSKDLAEGYHTWFDYMWDQSSTK